MLSLDNLFKYIYYILFFQFYVRVTCEAPVELPVQRWSRDLIQVSYTFSRDFISLLLKDGNIANDFGRTEVLLKGLRRVRNAALENNIGVNGPQIIASSGVWGTSWGGMSLLAD